MCGDAHAAIFAPYQRSLSVGSLSHTHTRTTQLIKLRLHGDRILNLAVYFSPEDLPAVSLVTFEDVNVKKLLGWCVCDREQAAL